MNRDHSGPHTHLAAHPRRGNPEAGLWPGKVQGHSIISCDHAFDPKGFHRYRTKPAAGRPKRITCEREF